MSKHKTYSPEEDDLIRELWDTGDGPEALVKTLDRGYNAIYNRAQRLGIKRSRRYVKLKFKEPRLLPPGIREGTPCPGNGNGACGSLLRRERVQSEFGYSTNIFDLSCGTHRFPAIEGK